MVGFYQTTFCLENSRWFLKVIDGFYPQPLFMLGGFDLELSGGASPPLLGRKTSLGMKKKGDGLFGFSTARCCEMRRRGFRTSKSNSSLLFSICRRAAGKPPYKRSIVLAVSTSRIRMVCGAIPKRS